MSKDFIYLQGIVKEVLPNNFFKVKINENYEILGIPSGKMKMNKIKILCGDKVKVEISPYDLTKGRIIWRG
ncbi:MAG: translation initiation factor IF-1 [Candidatus Dojkabacteria bacterium]|nr:translation initiation factor IF-1 [Candidatus Dojkabacteria bacterium]